MLLASSLSLPPCFAVGFMRPKNAGFSAAGICMWWAAPVACSWYVIAREFFCKHSLVIPLVIRMSMSGSDLLNKLLNPFVYSVRFFFYHSVYLFILILPCLTMLFFLPFCLKHWWQLGKDHIQLYLISRLSWNSKVGRPCNSNIFAIFLETVICPLAKSLMRRPRSLSFLSIKYETSFSL